MPKPVRSEYPKKGEGGRHVNGKQRGYVLWVELLKRMFRVGIEKCTLRGAKVKVATVINEHKIIESTLPRQEKTGRFNRAMPTYVDIIAQYRTIIHEGVEGSRALIWILWRLARDSRQPFLFVVVFFVVFLVTPFGPNARLRSRAC